VFATIPGDVDAHSPDACTVALTAESAELVVQFVAAIATLGAPVRVEETSDEVGPRVRELAAVLGAISRTIDGATGAPTS
jgi:hypothetical protein